MNTRTKTRDTGSRMPWPIPLLDDRKAGRVFADGAEYRYVVTGDRMYDDPERLWRKWLAVHDRMMWRQGYLAGRRDAETGKPVPGGVS